ncbi:MAG: tetratricopeptide repeat protein [Bdellovibrionales bacterium]|nr:tetratricopeptide repeat protein [Bdellovibrionales bacterium]
MAQDSKKWLIKNSAGLIQGPVTTSEVVKLLQRGQVTEEDFIASYPSSDWIPISHNPDFYDILLKIISDDFPDEDEIKESPEISEKININKKPKPPKQSKPPEQTKQPNVEPEKEEVFNRKKEDFKSHTIGTQSFSVDDFGKDYSAKKSSRSKSKKKKDPSIIELSSMDKAEKKEKIKSLGLPITILLGAALLLVYVFLVPGEKVSDRVRLLVPQQKRNLNRNEIVSLFKLGSQLYFMDTFNNYVKAQDKLVQVIEGLPSHLGAQSLLCMTYLELWPYSFKDSHDTRSISKVVQLAAKNDPSGVKGNPCKVVQHLLNNEYEEAESLTDGVLGSLSEEDSPPTFYYYLKALHLKRKGSYQSAIGYLSSVQQIIPQWLKTYVLEAELHASTKDYASAVRRLQQVLKVNPKHKEAMILWGLIEHKQFFRYASAKSMLKRAVSLKEGAPRKLLSEAYTSLAQIAIYENDGSHALEYAKKAYETYSANKEAQDIVKNLGGKVSNNLKGSQLLDEGEIFEKEGDYNAAQALYKSAYERNPQNGLAALKAAKCLWKLSLSTEAIEWLNKAVKADPKLVEAYITLSDYYSQRFNFEAASTILVKANKIAPNNFEIFRSYAQIEFRRRNYLGSINYGKRALQLFDSDVDTHILLSKSYMHSGSYNEAYNLANRAIELNPNSKEANIIYARATGSVRGKAAGIQYLQNVVSKYPLIKEYRLALGRLYYDDESYNDARNIFEQILKIDPNYKDAKIDLGRTYKNLNMLDDALDQFLQAAVMDPADAVPLFEAGLLYLQVKKFKKAVIQFERVLRINKIYPLAHFYIGKAYLGMSDYDKAIEFAKKERKINAKLADSYILAAEAYQKLGQFSLCSKEYHEAIKLRSLGAIIYVKLAVCYRSAGNLDIAESMLEKARSIENGLPDIYREQGQIYETKGLLDRAVQAYDRYLALSPNAPDAAMVRQRLRAMGVE